MALGETETQQQQDEERRLPDGGFFQAGAEASLTNVAPGENFASQWGGSSQPCSSTKVRRGGG